MNAVPMVIASARGQCASGRDGRPNPFGTRVGAHAAQWPLWMVVHDDRAVLQLLSVKRDVVEA